MGRSTYRNSLKVGVTRNVWRTHHPNVSPNRRPSPQRPRIAQRMKAWNIVLPIQEKMKSNTPHEAHFRHLRELTEAFSATERVSIFLPVTYDRHAFLDIWDEHFSNDRSGRTTSRMACRLSVLSKRITSWRYPDRSHCRRSVPAYASR